MFISTLSPNKDDVYGIPEWFAYNSDTEPKQTYVYDFRSVYLEEGDLGKSKLNILLELTKN